MYSGTSNTAQARAEEAAIARRQGSPTPVFNTTFSSAPSVSAKDQEMERLTAGGWSGSVNAMGQPVGDLAIYQAKNKQAVVDSGSAKKDLTKIQTDFQSILSGLQNKQNYNQAGLDVTNSVVDLMKSKGIADTSEATRVKLAQSAGISDYNSQNAESNKKLMEAIMSSKAVGSEMSKLPAGSTEYNSALGKVTETVAKVNPVVPPPAPAETLTSIGTKVSEDPMTAAYDKVTKEIDDNNTSITSSLNQLRTGAIPLTADQQAVVDSTQRSFDNAIKQQKTANQAQENIVRQASFRSGAEYTPEVSSSIIKNVIDANVLKISEYDQQAIGAVSKLKQDFKDANYKAIKEGYDSLQKTLKDKQDNMLSLMKLSHDYEKESLNYGLDVLKYNETVRSNKANEGKASGLTANQINTSINQLNTAFKGDQIVKNYNKLLEANTFVQNMSPTTTNPSDDQGLIYALAKALDPDSAVREGEYATAQKYSQSMINSYGKSITQALSGTGFLSEQARTNIKATIQQKYNASKEGYDNLANQYQQDINDLKNGVTRDLINYNYTTNSSSGGQPITIDSVYIQNMMNAGKSNAEIQQNIKDAKDYNASLTNVGGDTNQASKGIVAGYDIKSYATDPQHEVKIASIYQRIPNVNTANAVNSYINQVAKGSPVTGQAVIAAAQKYNVDPKMILAIMIQDSTLGTKGLAVKTKNPGNVGNTDSGATKTFKSWDDGVMAVAKNLEWRKINNTA